MFFCDMDELSFRTLQRRENLRKGCGAFGHDEFLTLRLTRRSRPVWIWQLRGFGQHWKSGSGPIGFIHNARTVSAAKKHCRFRLAGTGSTRRSQITVAGKLSMRILIDECVDEPLRLLFPYHDSQTTRFAQMAGLKNGRLLEAAEAADFDVLITVDRSIPDQQNLAGRTISLMILRAHKSPERSGTACTRRDFGPRFYRGPAQSFEFAKPRVRIGTLAIVSRWAFERSRSGRRFACARLRVCGNGGMFGSQGGPCDPSKKNHARRTRAS
jgi:hypothetical protein